MVDVVKKEIDPMELSGVCRIMTATSFNAYKTSWLDFVKYAKLSISKEPKEEDFEAFFAMKRESGLAGNTIRVIYSHLNKIYSHLYKKSLGVSILL